MWIGATDMAVEGVYQWSDGEPFNSSWPPFLTESKPPDNRTTNCLVTMPTTQWEPRNCADKYPALCEMNTGECCCRQLEDWNEVGNKVDLQSYYMLPPYTSCIYLSISLARGGDFNSSMPGCVCPNVKDMGPFLA